MANNFPGPYEVEITYFVDGLNHTQRLNCNVDGNPDVGDLPGTIDVVARDLSLIALDTAVNDWILLIRELFPSDMAWVGYSLWKYADLTNDRTFITSGVNSTVGQTSPPETPAHQVTFTFRTVEGGTMRIVLLETSQSNQTRVPYALTSAPKQAIFDYVTDPTGWILARDTSYPIVALNYIGGQNEAVFRSRFR